MSQPLDDPVRHPSADAFPPESFAPLLAKEVERSRRYYRGFGLMRVQLRGDAATSPSEREGAAAAEDEAPGEAGVPAEWLKSISLLLRRADILAHEPEGGLFVLLPETPASGVAVVSRRLEEALAQGETRGSVTGPAPAICQAAYPRDGETAGELLSALSVRTPS